MLLLAVDKFCRKNFIGLFPFMLENLLLFP